MHPAGSIILHNFGPNDPLAQLPVSRQIQYLQRYLVDIDTKYVLEEPNYFDKDYLAEFSNFYSTSARGYSNKCRRLHFFKGDSSPLDLLKSAAGKDEDSIKLLQENYLGFSVIRPIPSTPIGNTVFKLYNDKNPNFPRISTYREYNILIAGVSLKVNGLAWQQQDSGVGACATIALWSSLHSAAFDEYHAVPTTADITMAAHKTASLGSRVFPTTGLTPFQICEAIKELGLAPMVLMGEFKNMLFSPQRFATSCASFIRSGYPLIAIVHLEGVGLHAICISGFRESSTHPQTPGSVSLADSLIETIYLHDDNLGPNVRAKLINHTYDGISCCAIRAEAPTTPYSATSHPNDPTNSYPNLIPIQLIVPVHNELRTSADSLNKKALLYGEVFEFQSGGKVGFSVSSRFITLRQYIKDELDARLASNPANLSKIRLELWEKVPPMSFHLGLIRVGVGANVVADILHDTSDSDRNHPVFATIVYANQLVPAFQALQGQVLTNGQILDFGIILSV